jgi:hypothetical protein
VCTKGLHGVLLAAKNLHYKCVVQKYIERPLLVRYIYMYMYTIYMYVFTDVFVYTYLYIYMYVHMIHIDLFTYMHMYIYIHIYLLYRLNRKFDIRQWILVTSVDPLIIYGMYMFMFM